MLDRWTRSIRLYARPMDKRHQTEVLNHTLRSSDHMTKRNPSRGHHRSIGLVIRLREEHATDQTMALFMLSKSIKLRSHMCVGPWYIGSNDKHIGSRE